MSSITTARKEHIVCRHAKKARGVSSTPEILETRILLTASVSGVVFNDLNGNGTQDAGEPEFSSVAVTVTDGSGATVGSGTTTGLGEFNFTSLPTGENLTVAVRIPGYAAEGTSDGISENIYLNDGDSDTLQFAEQRTLAAPTNFIATSPTLVSSEVDLTWNNNSAGAESGFHIYDSVDGGAFGTTPIMTVASGSSSASVTGLSTSSDYAFDVAAYDANGDSNLSNTADAQGIISGVVFKDLNGDGVQQTSEGVFSGISVTVADSSGTAVGSATTNAAGSFTIAHLPINEHLTVTAGAEGWEAEQASTSGTELSGNDQDIVLSGGPTTVPFAELRVLPAPSGLSAVAGGSGQVNLAWTSNSNGMESGFHIYESVNGGTFGTTPAATVGSGVSSATITGLSSSTDYRFIVAAYDLDGDSFTSSYADANAPGTPSDVTTSAELDHSGVATATISWVPAADSPTGTTFNVYRSTDGSIPSTPLASGISADAYTDTSISAGQTYHYFVSAVSPTEISPGSFPASAPGDGGGIIAPLNEGTYRYSLPVYVPDQVVSPGGDSIYTHQTNRFYNLPTLPSSVGTATGSSMTLDYADSALFFDPFPFAANDSGAFGVSEYDSDSSFTIPPSVTVLDSSAPALTDHHPSYASRRNKGLDLGGVPSSQWIGFTTLTSICVGGDPSVTQAAILGRLYVTYTF